MFRKLLLMLFMVIGLLSCSDRKFNNPVDPLNIDENLAAPSQLTISVADENVLELNWRDNCDIEDGFSIERSSDAINFTKVAELAANVNTWQDTHVSLGNTYSYRIRITHESYTSQAVSSTISYRLLAPADIAIEQLTDTQFKLGWNDTNHFEEGYKIDLKVGAAAWQLDYASVPANSSSWIYTTDLPDTSVLTWRARAFYKSMHSAYTPDINLTVAAPIISPETGTHSSAFTAQISCATPGAQIRYTTNGSEPTETSNLYTGSISIEQNLNLKAKAYKAGWITSGTATASYIMMVAEPIISVPSGQYEEEITVSITCATSGAQIRYTVDGAEPTSSSVIYNTPLTLTTTTTLKAKAYKALWTASETTTGVYAIYSPIPANFTLVQGNGTVSPFYIDKYELTQSSYQFVMGTNPANNCGVGSNYPVYYVSWFKAIDYCNRRSMQEGLTPCYSYSTYGTNSATWPAGWNTNDGNHTNISCNWAANGYRLPTEAEWEFAARGGNQTLNYDFSGSNDINEVAWYTGNSDATTHIVGTKIGNELGIFDMSGNVCEWCWDFYSGVSRVFRGGNWNSFHYNCYVYHRFSGDGTYISAGVGFRCVRIFP